MELLNVISTICFTGSVKHTLQSSTRQHQAFWRRRGNINDAMNSKKEYFSSTFLKLPSPHHEDFITCTRENDVPFLHFILPKMFTLFS